MPSPRTRLRYCKSDAEITKAKMKTAEANKAIAEQKLRALEPRENSLRKEHASLAANLEQLESKEDKEKHKVFKSFCEQLGIESIKVYEAKALRETRAKLDARKRLSTHLVKLRTERDSMLSHDLDAPLQASFLPLARSAARRRERVLPWPHCT